MGEVGIFVQHQSDHSRDVWSGHACAAHIDIEILAALTTARLATSPVRRQTGGGDVFTRRADVGLRPRRRVRRRSATGKPGQFDSMEKTPETVRSHRNNLLPRSVWAKRSAGREMIETPVRLVVMTAIKT